MPTLDDLRATFANLAQHAPKPKALDLPPRPVEHRSDRPSQRVARRRWPVAVLASAAVVAVAVGATFAERPHQAGRTVSTTPAGKSTGHRPSAAAFTAPLPAPKRGESPKLSFGFAVTPVSGYEVTPTEIDATYQTAEIRSGNGAIQGNLFLYYAGAFDPAQVKTASPVSVNGQPGFHAQLRLPGQGLDRYDVLAWQYADNGWAVVNLWDGVAGRTAAATSKAGRTAEQNTTHATSSTAQGLPDLTALRGDELRLATATHSATLSVRVPLEITKLAGLHVTQLSPNTTAGGVAVTGRDGLTWDFGWGNSPLDPADKPNTNTTTFGGRSWLIYRDGTGTIMSLGVSAPGFGMTITPVGRTVTLAQYKQFLSHVHFPAAIGQPATWFPVMTALP